MGNISQTSTRRPVKRAAPSHGPERTIWERFGDDFADAASRSFVGAAVRKGADLFDWKRRDGETEEQHDRRIAQAERNRRAKYETRAASDPIIREDGSVMGDIGRGAVSLTAQILGGADPTYLIAPGGSALGRMAAQGAVAGSSDVILQGIEKEEGVIDDIDFGRSAAQTGLGVLFQGGMEGLSRVLRSRGDVPAERVVEDYRAAPEGEELVGYGRNEDGSAYPQYGVANDDAAAMREIDTKAFDGPVSREEVAPEVPTAANDGLTRRERSQAATRELSDIQPGGFKTTRPFPDSPGEEDYFRFRHVTEDGKEVTGTYTFDPETGVIDNFSINSKEGPNTSGPAAIRQLSRQLQSSHPEAKAIRAYRTTGARSGEEFVDIPLNRSRGGGGGNEPPRSNPPSGGEPMDPGRDPNKYVGNINLDRLNSTDDVAEALRGVQNDVAPLELQSQAETRKKADSLDMSEEDLLASRGLQGLEAQAVRSRDILKTVAEDTVRILDGLEDLESPEALLALARLGAVSEHVQHTINGPAGRILNSFKINADAVDAANTLTGALATPRGRARVKKLIDEYRNDPEALTKIARDAVNPTMRDFIFSFRYNMMLSSPKTHVYNILGTSGHILADLATHGLSAVIDLPRGMSGATDIVTGREVAARIIGLVKGAADSMDNVQQAWKTGRPMDDAARTDMKRGRTGSWELPVKAIAAVDEFFRSATYMSDLYGVAVRQAVKEGTPKADLLDRVQDLIENPTKGMLNDADEYSKRMRFQDTPSVFGQAIEQMRVHKKNDGPLTTLGRDGVSLVFPFVRTPDSLARTAIRYSPLGPFENVNWQDLRAGGARRSLALSRLALGSGLAAMTAMQVLEGNITGEGPRDYKKRQALELTGWQPRSIKVDGKYYSYDGLEPLAYVLSGTATTMERWDEGSSEGYLDQAGHQIFNFAEVLTNSSWSEGMADVFHILNAPEGQKGAAIDNFFANIAASFAVPAAARAVNQAYFDPITRDTRGDDSMEDRIVNRVKAGIPGLSDNLPAQLDALGRPIGREFAGPDIISRVSTPLAQNEPVAAELKRLMDSDAEGKAILERVDKSLNTKDYPMGRLTALEQHNYQLVTGTYFTALMEEALASPEYQAMDDEAREAEVREIAKQAREWAREEVFSEPEGSTESNPEAQPSQEADEGEEFTFGIPTSMRRTVAGNRAVGGVENSAHLTGDGIDFVRAPGISWEELMAEAKRFFGPDAEVIFEGDHVHVELPGMDAPYYGERGTI